LKVEAPAPIAIDLLPDALVLSPTAIALSPATVVEAPIATEFLPSRMLENPNTEEPLEFAFAATLLLLPTTWMLSPLVLLPEGLIVLVTGMRCAGFLDEALTPAS